MQMHELMNPADYYYRKDFLNIQKTNLVFSVCFLYLIVSIFKKYILKSVLLNTS